MNIIEEMHLLEKKEQELDKYRTYEVIDISKFITISVISFILCIVGGVASVIFLIHTGYFGLFVSTITCFLIATLIFHITVPVAIVFGVKQAKAPSAIKKLEEEISLLKVELYNKKESILKNVLDRKENKENKDTNDLQLSKTEDLDLLIKYKELLDKNIITEEEFNQKKKELLK